MKPVISSDLSREQWRLKITPEALSESPFQSRLAAVKTRRQQALHAWALGPVTIPPSQSDLCLWFTLPPGSVGCILNVEKKINPGLEKPIIAAYFPFLHSKPRMRMEYLIADHFTWNYVWIQTPFPSTLLSDVMIIGNDTASVCLQNYASLWTRNITQNSPE